MRTATRPTAGKPRAKKRAGTSAPAVPETSTIGHNPLDAIVPAGAVAQLASSRRRLRLVEPPQVVASSGPGPAVKLTITVPQALADQVQGVLALRTDLSFDQLMSTALAEVLQSLRSGGHRGRARVVSTVKDLSRDLSRR